MAETVLSTDTPNQGRVKWNNNDVANESALNTHKSSGDHDGRYALVGHNHAGVYDPAGSAAAVQSALDTHKSSSDHDAHNDGRYLTVGYLSSLVRTTLDQVVAGIKTFTSNVFVKKTSPAVELQHDDGTPLAKLSGTFTPEALMRLEVGNGGSYTTVLQAQQGSGDVDFPNHRIKSKGIVVATVEDVARSVRSGSAYVHGQTDSISASGSGYTKVGSATQLLSIPAGSRITKVAVAALNGTSVVQYEATCSVSVPDGLVKLFVQTSGTNAPTFSVRDRNDGNLFSFSSTSSPGASAVFAITLTVSV